MTTKRKSKKPRKTASIRVPLTPADKKRIKQRAKQAGIKPAAWVRMAAIAALGE